MLHTRNNTAGARLSASLRWLLILLLVMPSVTVWSAPAAPTATPIVVTTTADEFGGGSGCSLREAVESANTGSDFGGCTGANATANIITLTAGTYTLTGAAGEDSNASGDLDIKYTLTINGAGAKATAIQAGTDTTNGVDRVLDLSLFANVEINGVTIRYGKAPDGVDGAADETCRGGDGGGIYVKGYATLTLNDCVVHYNRAGAGGDGCTASSPLDRVGGQGGGIYCEGTLELDNTRIMHNEAGAGGAGTVAGTFAGSGGYGGGIYLDGSGSQATLTNYSAVNLNSSGDGGTGATVSSGDAGNGGNGGAGGGVYSRFGSLTLMESTISGNTTGDGGDGGDSAGGDGGDGSYSGAGAGVYAYGGAAAVVLSLVEDNIVGLAGSGGSGTGSNGLDGWRNSGGGLKAEAGADVSLTDTTVEDNTGLTGGGLNGGGSGTVIALDGCTVSGNHALQYGGGLYGGGGSTLALTNSTISGNTADEYGGGFYGSTLTLTFVTVAYNIADADGTGAPGDGGGFFGTDVTLTNTIVAQNIDTGGEDPDCHSGYGTTTLSGDYNLLGIGDSPNCNLASQAHDLVGTTASPIDPLLGALGDKGGPTWTHSLNLSSPAVGYIPEGVNGCVPGIRDQRGMLRFPPCNIGAFEADRVEKVYLPLVVKP